MASLVVETGTGTDSTANSLATVAQIDTIAANERYMAEWLALTSDNKAKCAITGTRLLCEYLSDELLGYPLRAEQPLCFPRSGLYTKNGAAISSSSVPAGAVQALAKIANLLAISDVEASQKTGLASGNVGSLQAVFDKYDRDGVIQTSVRASLSFCLEARVSWQGMATR